MTGPAHPSVTTLLAEISVLPLLVESDREVRQRECCGCITHCGAFLGFSQKGTTIPAASPCHAAFFFRRAEHRVTEDRLATKSSQLSIGTCVVCGQSEGRAAQPRVVGRGGGGGRGSEIRSRNAAAAAAHCLNCPPRVKLFNFSPFARLNPTLGEQKPKVGNDQEMGAQ